MRNPYFQPGMILKFTTRKSTELRPGDVVGSNTAYPERIRSVEFHDGSAVITYFDSFSGKERKKRIPAGEDVWVLVANKRRTK